MYLEFNQVVINKFRTIRKPITLPLTHPNPGLRFVRGINEVEPDLGSNGVAKSSLFAAVCWCLYGQTVDKLTTVDLIPWETEDTPDVTTTLHKDDEKLVVHRLGNKFVINGKKASQEEITRLIPFEIFIHTILLGQEQDLFFDLSPREKMDILSAALNLDRWETHSDAAATKAKAVDREIDEIAADLQSCADEHDTTTQFLKDTEAQTANWSANRAERRKGRQAEIDGLSKHLDKQQKIEATAELALDSAETELKALDVRRTKVSEALTEAKMVLARAKVVIEGLEDAAQAIHDELDQLTGEGDVCPTCGQSIKGTALATHKKGLETQLRGLQAKVKVGVPKKVTHLVDTLTSELAEVDRHRTSFQEKIDKARATLKMVTTTSLQTDIRALEKQQAEADDEVNPYREQVSALRKKRKELGQRLKDLQDDLTDAEQDLARLKFWVTGFKEVRLNLIEEFLQELEMATNAMLPESGLHNWAIRYDIERETKKGSTVAGLNVTVLSPHNTKPVKWKVWSGGEKRRLRVVGALALSEVLLSHAGVQTNLEILDEPTRGLSTEGVQDLFAYLSARAKQLDKDIFAIDHMAVESRYFAEVITVVRNTEGSFIDDDAHRP